MAPNSGRCKSRFQADTLTKRRSSAAALPPVDLSSSILDTSTG